MAMDGTSSGASTGYYKTESNYAPVQREKYNLNRVPENNFYYYLRLLIVKKS